MKLLLRAGLSTLIIGLLAYKISWPSLARVFSEMHLGLTLFAFMLLHIGQSFSSWRWMILAKPLGFNETYGRYRSLFYIGTFFNLFLPTSIGGDAVRAWMLAPKKNSRLAAFGSVIADRVAGVTVKRHMAPRRAGDPDALVADNRRITKTFSWQPRWGNLDTIVSHALAWERQLNARRKA